MGRCPPGDRLTLRARLAAAAVAFALVGCQPTPPIATIPEPVEGPESTSTEFGSLTASRLSETDRAAWTQRIEQAARTVRAAEITAAVRPGWQGKLDVVIATDAAEFASRTATPADAASAATTCTDGASEIVVNPVVLVAGDPWLRSTLVHEGVHVATASACVPSGKSLGWATEGLAESVAAGADPSTASRNHKLVIDYLASHALPDKLPSELNTLTDYALAQLAVDQVIKHRGRQADDFLARAIHQAAKVTEAEHEQVRSWYVAELRRLRDGG
ncbi:MAG TPA: hypothetical protein PLL50_06045 [Propionicimonas sp.]|nr:hypothetical protein [Propionicimonas sp.]HQA77900.1 hypothetical protein [Propionicimonas sp.]